MMRRASPLLFAAFTRHRAAAAVVMAVTVLACSTLAGCQKPPAGPAALTAQPPLLIAPEDVQTLGTSPFSTGPVITGSIQPERRAVRQGDLLVHEIAETQFRPLKVGQGAERTVQFRFRRTHRVERLLVVLVTAMTEVQAENIGPCAGEFEDHLGAVGSRADGGDDLGASLPSHVDRLTVIVFRVAARRAAGAGRAAGRRGPAR